MVRELRAVAWKALAYALVLEAMLVAAILYWPQFRDNIPAILRLVPGKVMGGMVAAMTSQGAQGYVTFQHFFKGCHLLGGAAAAVFAAGAVAGEAHRGTLEIWLALPFSRRRLLAERYVAGLLAVALPILATTATIPWLLSLVKEDSRLLPYALAAVHECVFLAAIYSATFLVSALGSRPVAIAFGAILVLVLELALYLVMDLTHGSIYRLADIDRFSRIYETGALDPRVLIPLALASAVCFLGAQAAFARRVP
jgi:ABC-type transport system involved in multi-copper enzyme maturation permease subunit